MNIEILKMSVLLLIFFIIATIGLYVIEMKEINKDLSGKTYELIEEMAELQEVVESTKNKEDNKIPNEIVELYEKLSKEYDIDTKSLYIFKQQRKAKEFINKTEKLTSEVKIIKQKLLTEKGD